MAKARKTSTDVKEAADTIEDTVYNSAHTVIDRAQALLEAIADELNDRIKGSLEVVRREYGMLGNRVKGQAATAEKFIHDESYKAIGVGFVAGLLFGWFMSRK